MSLKLVKGSGIDLHLNPENFDYKTRGEVSDKYISMKLLELQRYFNFWVLFVSCILLGIIAIFLSKLLLIPLIFLVHYTVKYHFKYLQAWSAWNKFARKYVVRVDLEKEHQIYEGLLTPWVKFPKELYVPREHKIQALKQVVKKVVQPVPATH